MCYTLDNIYIIYMQYICNIYCMLAKYVRQLLYASPPIPLITLITLYEKSNT